MTFSAAKVSFVGPDLWHWFGYVAAFSILVCVAVFQGLLLFVLPRCGRRSAVEYNAVAAAVVVLSVFAFVFPFALPSGVKPFLRYSVACYSFILAWKGAFEGVFLGTLLPRGAVLTRFEFLLHFVFPVPVALDSETHSPVRASPERRRELVLSYGLLLAWKAALTVTVFSLVGTTALWDVAPRVAPYARHFIVLVVVFLFLSITSDAITVLLAALRFDPLPCWKSVFLGTSRRDYWRRWNLMMGRMFHRSVFAMCSRRDVGAALVFLLSGLFHEYTYSAAYGGWPTPWRSVGLPPYTGWFVAFFAQEALITTAEVAIVSRVKVFKRIPSALCTVVQIAAVLYTPINWMFLEPLIAHDLLGECASLFPRFVSAVN